MVAVCKKRFDDDNEDDDGGSGSGYDSWVLHD